MRLIKFAQAPSSVHTKETSEILEEAKLDEAWDLQLFVPAARVKASVGYSKENRK
jgi:hypothetical protein